jgi:REP element-mobilizing transposase RayT
MPSKYIISDHQDAHFLSFAVVQWVDALSRQSYKDIIVDSLRYCQEHKGMILYAYVVMSNHVHFICAAKEGYNLSDIIRDMKKHTSKKLLGAIQNNPHESRKSWMMWIFKSAGEHNPNNKDFQFWQQDNRPIQLSTVEMARQRLDYIHQNPVKEGLVKEAQDYIYSSAANYCSEPGLIPVEFLF